MKKPAHSPEQIPMPVEPESEADVKYAAEAEMERERIWNDDKCRQWNGEPLQPWSRERATLLARLVAADVPGGDLSDLPLMRARLADRQANAPDDAAVQALTLEQIVDVMVYLPMAAKLLYLASHQPRDWDHLRGERVGVFLREIETWADEAIPPGEEWKAVHTAVQTLTAHQKMMAMRRPTPGARRHEGN